MPPSPAMRCSPGRELNHKRGRSLEGGLRLKEKDDELALFTEMRNREREGFLIHLSDDIESSLPTKFKYLSELKLGGNIPARGESSDLLHADGDKNDYDWLLTPPDTPLFPSLDKEDEKPPSNLIQRGRPRSQPIYISRTSTAEKSYRGGRSSASPNRLSPSPRTSPSNNYLSRGRSSSASHTSPGPILRSGTPSKRPTTPNNPSSTSVRSSTPTVQRVSTGSGTNPASARSGTSPGKLTRGNSASPKLQAWQASLPGFSLDAPPNLRTSLTDRPASHVRGSSPASRSGKDASYSTYRRQSMSPTASRSASSSHSFDPDRFSSQSKGSVASSGDDDTDSLQSIPVMLSQHSSSRNSGSISKTKNIVFSKRPNRTISVGSAPKRSFEYAVRQMDNHKGPQNMFRPLLSSVPSSTFYSGKAKLTHSAISIYSSITSSNASSDPGVNVTLDAEDNEHSHDDSKSEWLKTQYSENQDDEIFVLDGVEKKKMTSIVDGGKEGVRHGGSGECASKESSVTNDTERNQAGTSNRPPIDSGTDSAVATYDTSKVASCDLVVICAVCLREFENASPMIGDLYVCPSCSAKCRFIGESPPILASVYSDDATSENKMAVNTAAGMESDGAVVLNSKESCFLDPSASQITILYLNNFEETNQSECTSSQEFSIEDSGSTKLEHLPRSKNDVSEGLGISVLLKGPDITKWPVVQGRSFTASTISCGNFSFTRDSSNCRSCSVEGSASASSSIDLNSHAQQRFGGKKVDMEVVREDFNRMLLSSRSSVSGFSDSCYEATVYSEGFVEDRADETAKTLGIEGIEDAGFVPKESKMLEEEEFDHLRDNDCRALDLSSVSHHIDIKGSLAVEVGSNQNCHNPNAIDIFPDDGSTLEPTKSHVYVDNNEIEAHTENLYAPGLDDICGLPHRNGMKLKGDCEVGSPDGFQPVARVTYASEQLTSSIISEGNELLSALDANGVYESTDINEKPVVEIGIQGRQCRSLTLDEATDSILFCSSIVHSLAYEAASIAIEKENPVVPLEVHRPSKPSHLKFHRPYKPSQSGRSGMKDSNKYLRPKPAKTRPKQAEQAVKPMPLQKPDNDALNQGILEPDLVIFHKPDTMKPPNLESKCNCTIM